MKTLIACLHILIKFIGIAALAIAGVLTTQCVIFIIHMINTLGVGALDTLTIMTLPEWQETLLSTWNMAVDITKDIILAVIIYLVVSLIIRHFDGTKKSVMVIHTAIATGEDKL